MTPAECIAQLLRGAAKRRTQAAEQNRLAAVTAWNGNDWIHHERRTERIRQARSLLTTAAHLRKANGSPLP